MKTLNLRVRMLVLYILLAVTPTVVIFLFYMKSYIEAVEEDAVHSLLQTLRQASLNISNEIESAKRISDYFFTHEDILKALRADPNQQYIDDQIMEITKLRNIRISATQGMNVKAVRLFVDDIKIYANQRVDFFPLSEFYADHRFANVTSRGDLISTYLCEYVSEAGPTEVVSLARLIKDVNRISKTIGAIVIDIEESKIFSLLNQIDFRDEYLIYVIDESGCVISRHNPELFGQIKTVKSKTESINQISSTFYVTVPIEGSPWSIVAEMPSSSMRAGYLATRVSLVVFLVLLVIIIGMVFIVNIVSINGITLRVQGIANVLIEEWGGIIPKTAGMDERKRGIYSSLDQSLLNIRILIKAVYEQMEKQRRTQLELLQIQINPHFLYNTLDTVQWMVRAEDKENAEAVISALTCYLRLILNNGRDEVTVEDEIGLANAYTAIQKKRFGNSFDIDFIVEPDAPQCLLPKLTIQPVIENALYHGLLKLKDRRGRIDIDIYTEDDTLNISITDNGVGMDSATIEKLLSATRDKHSGFGLFNVNQRILLFSGCGCFGASIESEVGKYTTIHLKIAKKLNEKEKT